MNNKTIKNGKQGHHDDCDDCKRQKKQNQALIAIYERLQAIDNNSKVMRKSLDKHKQQFENTNTKFKDFVNKFNQIPKQSKTDMQLKNLGNQMAFAMMHEVTKGAVARQNQYLKNTLVRLYKPKNQLNNSQVTSSARRSLSVNTDNFAQSNSLQIPKPIENSMQKSLYKNFIKNEVINSQIQQIKQARQIEEQTRTTGFFSFQNNINRQKVKMDGLNLWLYQQNQNKNLQEQLYQTRVPTRYKISKTTKRKGVILPALKNTNNKL